MLSLLRPAPSPALTHGYELSPSLLSFSAELPPSQALPTGGLLQSQLLQSNANHRPAPHSPTGPLGQLQHHTGHSPSGV